MREEFKWKKWNAYDGDGDEVWECPECEFELLLSEGDPWDNEYYFCPKCGADLRVKNVNEWHYPSKGELPTDDRRVLCKLKGVEDWYECGGYNRDNDEWFFECINLPGDSILAWQYIIPPKEEA